jgi:PPOX class probable F420-dependent enzyme
VTPSSAIADMKYVRLTTFTKDGRRKESPVWIAHVGDSLVGVTTYTNTWKIKRIRNTPTVELTPCDSRGNVESGAHSVTGTAIVVTGVDFLPVTSAIRAKYGIPAGLASRLGKLLRLVGFRPYGDECGIVIRLDEQQ